MGALGSPAPAPVGGADAIHVHRRRTSSVMSSVMEHDLDAALWAAGGGGGGGERKDRLSINYGVPEDALVGRRAKKSVTER